MNIVWHGLSTIELAAKNAEREVRVIVDPYESSVGLRTRSFPADLALVSHDAPEAQGLSSVEATPFVVRMPGEFEVGGVFVYSISAPRADGAAHTIFRIEAEGISIAHLGALDRKLHNEEIKTLGDIDILCIAVGGGSVLSAEDAVEVVQSIDPRVVVPMYFGGTKLPVKEDSLKQFLKELGVAATEEVSKLKITKNQLTGEDLRIVVLSRD